MNFELFMEIFGYVGTALVIFSMLMTSVVKLRLINLCGSLISAIYAFESGAFPVVVLNASLMIINVIQLLRLRSRKPAFHRVVAAASDPSLAYFLSLYKNDIEKYYPAYALEEHMGDTVHFVYCESEIVGVLIGRRDADLMELSLDYSTPKYRDLSVSRFLYDCLQEDGISVLTATGNQEYFLKMGFEGNEIMLKKL